MQQARPRDLRKVRKQKLARLGYPRLEAAVLDALQLLDLGHDAACRTCAGRGIASALNSSLRTDHACQHGSGS